MTKLCRCGHTEDRHLAWKDGACDAEVRAIEIANGKIAVERCGCRGYVLAEAVAP